MRRRRFLERTIVALSGIIGAVLAIPLLASLGAPAFRRPDETTREILDEEDLPSEGDVREVSITLTRQDGWMQIREPRTLYVLRHRGELHVLSSRCTHAGCRVNWNGEQGRFLCPCHGGEFSIDGQVVRQPPRDPLARYPAQVKDGRLTVTIEA